jgi:hypothetical protein
VDSISTVWLPNVRPPNEILGFERNTIREQKKKSPYSP